MLKSLAALNLPASVQQVYDCVTSTASRSHLSDTCKPASLQVDSLVQGPDNEAQLHKSQWVTAHSSKVCMIPMRSSMDFILPLTCTSIDLILIYQYHMHCLKCLTK